MCSRKYIDAGRDSEAAVKLQFSVSWSRSGKLCRLLHGCLSTQITVEMLFHASGAKNERICCIANV